MTTQQPVTPEEKIADLYSLVNQLTNTVNSMEDTIYYLRRDLSAKAEERHSHDDLERAIRDAEYHTHREYADVRHIHNRWDIQ